MHSFNLCQLRSRLPGLVEPTVGPFATRARKRIVVGLDSMVNGGGQPGLATGLRTLLTARHGDGGPGLSVLDHAAAAANFAGGDFAVSEGFINVATLAWDDTRRKRAPFGRGLMCENDCTDEEDAEDYLLLSGASETVTSVDLYFEWTAAGQSFRLRQWPTEPLASGLHVRQEDFPELDRVHKVTLLLDVGGVYAGKGIDIEKVVCQDAPVFFWAVEFHEPHEGGPGVQVIDVSLASAGIAQWSALDDARMRAWVRLFQPDVFVLIAGVNDRGEGPLSDVEARANAAIYAHHLGHVIPRLHACARTSVVLARPPDPLDADETAIRFYDRALKAAAWAHGCAYHDERDALGDFAAADAAGFMSEDGVHPSATGNAARAKALAARLWRIGQ